MQVLRPLRRRRASRAVRPSGTAVCRAVHHVLAARQPAALLVHRRHVDPATALQVAGDLHVAREGGGECYRRRPGSAVVGVDYLQCSTANREVVKGHVHAPVVGAGRVVVTQNDSRSPAPPPRLTAHAPTVQATPSGEVQRPKPWPPQPVAMSPANHKPRFALYTTIGSPKLVPWPEQRGWLACQVTPLSVE